MNSKRVCPVIAAGLLFVLLLTFASCAGVSPPANNPTITLTSLTETAFESTPATTPVQTPHESKTALELLTDAYQRIDESAMAYDVTITNRGVQSEEILRFQYSIDGDSFAAFKSDEIRDLNDGVPTDTTNTILEYEDSSGYYKETWNKSTGSHKIKTKTIYTYETPTDASARQLRFLDSFLYERKVLERSDEVVYNNDGSVSFHVALNDPAHFVRYHVGNDPDIPADKKQMVIDGLTDYEEELSFEIDADGFPKHCFYHIRYRAADDTGGGEISSLDQQYTIEFNSVDQPFDIERPEFTYDLRWYNCDYGEYHFEENGLRYDYVYAPQSLCFLFQQVDKARDYDEETASGVGYIHGELNGLTVVFLTSRALSYSGFTERGFIINENASIIFDQPPSVSVFVQREQLDKEYFLGQWGYDENGVPQVEPDISD